MDFHQLARSVSGLTLATALATSANAQLDISKAANHAVGQRPSGVAVGDFNSDGYVDIATSTDTPDKVEIHLNDGAGNFTPGPVVFFPSSSSPDDLQAGDFDGDGDLDLAVIARDLLQVRIVTNTNGSFALGASAPIGANAQGMDVADIDGDGDLDIGVANRDSNTATILRNAGNATFTAITIAQPVGGEPRGVAFGSFTGSGPLGIAVANHDTRTVNVFAPSGDVFAPVASLLVGTQDRPDGITAIDLNGDGTDDIATVSGDDTPAQNRVVIFFASPNGAFSNPAYAPTGSVVNSSDIVAADLDCDGVNDLAVSNQDSNNISVLQNIGNGTFAAPVLRTAGTRPGRINAADVDGDGDNDLAVANRDSNNISIFVNNTCTQPTMPGDTNGDGVVNTLDLLNVINAWGLCASPPCSADVAPASGDGVINVADLLMVINNWG